MITTPTVVTREEVKDALDAGETSRSNRLIDRAIVSATEDVEGLLNRVFYPTVATRYFDWPNRGVTSRAWRLWLDENDLISLTSLVSGGVTIPPADYFLEPVNSGPPYTRIEIDLSSQSAFTVGSTHQRTIAATGLWGYNSRTTPGGVLGVAISSTSATTITVSDSSKIGVGDMILVDSERMTVTDRAMADTSVVFSGLQTTSAADNTLSVTSGTAFSVGEVLRFDAERCLIVDITGNTLVLKRAVDGTQLSAHTGGTIYASRLLTVVRGALGTTAATHLISAPISVGVPPGLVKELGLAYALNNHLQAQAAYARVAGSGDNASEFTGRGIKSLERDVRSAHGRMARMRTI
jgi:hypothetical protein